MSPESLIALLLGVPVGVISGLYSGLIVARYQRFSDLRATLLKIIREIDFSDEGSHLDFPKRKDVSELVLIAGDFYFLRHTQAGEKTNELDKEIRESLYLAVHGKIDYNQFSNRYSQWQTAARHLKPNPLRLLSLWGGL